MPRNLAFIALLVNQAGLAQPKHSSSEAKAAESALLSKQAANVPISADLAAIEAAIKTASNANQEVAFDLPDSPKNKSILALLKAKILKGQKPDAALIKQAEALGLNCGGQAGDCVAKFAGSKVQDFQNLVKEGKAMDPALLQRAANQRKTNSLLSLDTDSKIKLNVVAVPDNSSNPPLIIEDKVSDSIARTLSTLKIAKELQENLSAKAVDAQIKTAETGLGSNLSAFEAAALAATASSNVDRASPSPAVQNFATREYIDRALGALQLSRQDQSSLSDHLLYQAAQKSTMDPVAIKSFVDLRRLDANGASPSDYVAKLNTFAGDANFQQIVEDKLGKETWKEFRAATAAAILSNDKSASLSKLNIVSDLFQQSTGLPGPLSALAFDEKAPGFAFTTALLPDSETAAAADEKSFTKAFDETARSLSSEDELDWVQEARSLSSTKALSQMRALNPTLASLLSVGSKELFVFIQDLKTLYSLGFLKLLDPDAKMLALREVKSTRARVLTRLQRLAKQKELAGIKNKIAVLQTKLAHIDNIEAPYLLLREFIGDSAVKSLLRKHFIDDYRLLRTETAYFLLLTKLSILDKRHALGTLVLSAMEQSKAKAKLRDEKARKDALEAPRTDIEPDQPSQPNDDDY